MRIKTGMIVLAGSLLALAANAAVVRQNAGDDLVPTGKGWGTPRVSAPSASGQVAERARKPRPGNTGISYHGGPVMTGTPTLYYIYYGTWSAAATTILNDFASTLGGSPYENINSTYWQTSSTGPHVSGLLTFGGSTSPGYSLGTALSDANIQTIVATALSTGALPTSSNAVYLVLTSADVNETSGFCTAYCGWHTHATIAGQDIKYGFVGNTDRCPSACEGFPNNSPNGDTGADGATSIIAHEQEEAISDPDLNAWFDTLGNENADKCAYNYGATYIAPNGAIANVHLGSRDFLIQQNWVNAGTGGCLLHYP